MADLAVQSRRKVKLNWLRVLSAILWTSVVAAAIWSGVAVRRWEYPATTRERFDYDINNAWSLGRGVIHDARKLAPKADRVSFANLMRAYLGRYDAVIKDKPNGDYVLDYPPARLLIMSSWAWHETDGGRPQKPAITLFGVRIGPGRSYPPPAELAGPLLNANTVFELLAMAGAFMLTRAVVQRDNARWPNWLALVPAILLWFNPALLADAHAWPQWEAWVLPFWLWAGYFAVTRRWLAVGLCLGVGTMFKGQIAIVMAFFVLWPIFQAKWKSALEVGAGILFGTMLCVSPWMLMSTAAKVAVGAVVVATLVCLRWLPRGWRILTLCSVTAVSLLAAGLWLGGSFGWFTVGFDYGARRWQEMTMGGAPNLAAAMGNFGWRMTDVVLSVNATRPRIHLNITVQQLLAAIYAVALLLSSIGAALQDSRKDRRLLLAMAAPWIAMFAFLPQMHERYLLWGAVFSALGTAVSVGSLLLYLMVTFLAFVPIASGLAGSVRSDYPVLNNFLDQAISNGALCVILVAMIYLYLSLSGPRRQINLPGPARQTSDR